MAVLTVVDLPGKYEDNIANTPVDPGFVAGDLAGDEMPIDNRTILLVRSTDAGAQTITITSFPSAATGRLGDITNASIAPGAVVAFQNFPQDGWANSQGRLAITVSAVTLELAAIRVASL